MQIFELFSLVVLRNHCFHHEPNKSNLMKCNQSIRYYDFLLSSFLCVINILLIFTFRFGARFDCGFNFGGAVAVALARCDAADRFAVLRVGAADFVGGLASLAATLGFFCWLTTMASLFLIFGCATLRTGAGFSAFVVFVATFAVTVT